MDGTARSSTHRRCGGRWTERVSAYFARVERATETDVDVVVEEARIVAHRVRVRHGRRVRYGTVYKVVEVDVIDALPQRNGKKKKRRKKNGKKLLTFLCSFFLNQSFVTLFSISRIDPSNNRDCSWIKVLALVHWLTW